jgi:bifunctional non-homologous end joining protein LigD
MSDQCPNCPPKADFPILELPPPRTFLAGFIAPCLPTKTDKLPSGSDWLHEIKHDGLRIIARKNGAQVRLRRRSSSASVDGRVPALPALGT